MVHACYIIAILAAVIAVGCLLKSQAGIRAELHADDQLGEGNQR